MYLVIHSDVMGLTNNSPYTFKSGPTCTGTYMRVNTPLHCVTAEDGTYHAKGTLMTYYNQEARLNNLDPMEIGDIDLEIDPSGVFQVVFAGLKEKFTNCTDVVDPVIQQKVTEPAATDSTSTPAATGGTSTPAATDSTSTPAATDSTSTPAATGSTSTPAATTA